MWQLHVLRGEKVFYVHMATFVCMLELMWLLNATNSKTCDKGCTND